MASTWAAAAGPRWTAGAAFVGRDDGAALRAESRRSFGHGVHQWREESGGPYDGNLRIARMRKIGDHHHESTTGPLQDRSVLRRPRARPRGHHAGSDLGTGSSSLQQPGDL